MANIIEEYLVKIGATIDDKSIREVDESLSKVNKMVMGVGSLGKTLVKAAGFIGGAYISLAGAMVGLTTSMAKQDQEMETLARTMFIGKEQAVAMKQAMDSLGASMQDIQINPELRRQFNILMQDANQMADSTGAYETTMRGMREVMFETVRFKNEIQSALKWVAYYLIRDFAGPLNKGKEILRDLNNTFIRNMPKITREVATKIKSVIDVGISFFRLIKNIGKRLMELWDSFPPGTKKAIVAISALAAVLMTGPIGWMSAAIVAVLLLIDDFFGYLDGKDAALGPIWQQFIDWADTAKEKWNALLGVINKFFTNIEESPAISKFIKVVRDLGEAIWELNKAVWKLITDALMDLWEYLRDTGTITEISAAFGILRDGLLEMFEGVVNLIKGFTKLLKVMAGSPAAKTFWVAVKKIIDAVVESTVKAIRGVGKLASIIGKLLKGDFAGAMKDMGSMIGGAVAVGDAEAGDAESIGAMLYMTGKNAGINWSAEDVAGILANLRRESDLDPNAHNPNDEGQESGGLAQWRSDRLESLRAYAKSKGEELSADNHYLPSLKTQLEFLVTELKGSESEALHALLSANGAGAKAAAFTAKFERPDMSNPNVQEMVTHQNITADAYLLKVQAGIAKFERAEMERTQKEKEARARADMASRQQKRLDNAARQGGIIPMAKANLENMSESIAYQWNKTFGHNSVAKSSLVNVGDVNVYVQGSNASPEEIGKAVQTKVSSILPNRNMSSVFSGGSGIA